MFLNVPFDRTYERQFVALLAAVIAVGRSPRCVLELPASGRARLPRILTLLSECDVSLHDLSKVGAPARFNMPFELGLACAVAELRQGHGFILLEREQYRVQKTLSDLNGYDPYIHHGTVRGMLRSVLSALRPTTAAPAQIDVWRLYTTMRAASEALTRSGRDGTVFDRSCFLTLVAVGVERAAQTGLIPS